MASRGMIVSWWTGPAPVVRPRKQADLRRRLTAAEQALDDAQAQVQRAEAAFDAASDRFTEAESALDAARSSSPAPGGATTAPSSAPAGHPACDNARLNASLAPSVSGQKSSVFVIAVKNAGPTCTLGPLPYVWITKSPTDVSEEARPLVPGVDTGKKNIILSGTTLYAAIDLLPGPLATTTGNYGALEVTANPTPDTSGKDVQDVVLPGSTAAGGAKLGVYATNPSLAIDQIQYATTPEK